MNTEQYVKKLKKIFTVIIYNNIGPRTVLVEKCTGRFLNKFNDYIDKAIVYTKENL